MSDEGPGGEVNYHLELTPEQLKVTHTALKSLLDDFGHDEKLVRRVIHEVLGKLPDEHSIRAIQLGSGERGSGEPG
jgi:Ni,Fe-hydrogenase III large subunit